MDRRALEFWGNYLLMVAKGQRQAEDMAQWIRQGYKGFKDLSDMFASLYGIRREHGPGPTIDKRKVREGTTSSKRENKDWHAAISDFQNSMAKWLRPMGWVPAQANVELKEKIKILEEKLESKEKTIRHLQNLLNQQGDPQTDVIMGFAELVQKQSREFQDILKKMGETSAERKKDA